MRMTKKRFGSVLPETHDSEEEMTQTFNIAEAEKRVSLKHELKKQGIPYDKNMSTEVLIKLGEKKTMSEVEVVKKADPKYDWKPVIEKLAGEYRQVYGDEVDPDTVFEFIREKHEEEALVGYEEWDYCQAVTERLIAMIEAEGGEIPSPDDEEEDEPAPKPKVKEKEKKPKTPRKKPSMEKVEQGHLEFTCHKGLLRNFSKKIRVAGNEVKIHADEKGISCRMVDPSHVCMVEVSIPCNDFYIGSDVINKKIHYVIDKPLEFGLDLDDLDGILRLLDGQERIHVKIDENEMILETTNDKPIRKKIILIDTCGMPDYKEPKLDFDLEAEVDRQELGILQKATAGNSKPDNTTAYQSVEKVQLVVDGKYLKAILFDSDDEGELSITLSKKVKGTGKCLYSPDYMNSILSALTENKPVTLRWGTDLPIRFIGKLQDNGNYNYLLAPRIEAEG